MINLVEIWYNLTQNEVNEFEIVDRMLLQHVLGKIPRTVPRESMYLELGIEEINVIIKKRRLVYFQSVMAREKKSMLYSFLIRQWHRPCKGDFTELVKQDIKDHSLPEEWQIYKNHSKKTFKRLLNIKIVCLIHRAIFKTYICQLKKRDTL